MLLEKSQIPALPLYPWANGFTSGGLSFSISEMKPATPTHGAITRTNEVIHKSLRCSTWTVSSSPPHPHPAPTSSDPVSPRAGAFLCWAYEARVLRSRQSWHT